MATRRSKGLNLFIAQWFLRVVSDRIHSISPTRTRTRRDSESEDGASNLGIRRLSSDQTVRPGFCPSLDEGEREPSRKNLKRLGLGGRVKIIKDPFHQPESSCQCLAMSQCQCRERGSRLGPCRPESPSVVRVSGPAAVGPGPDQCPGRHSVGPRPGNFSPAPPGNPTHP